MSGTKKSQKDESQEQSEWYVACMVGQLWNGCLVECSDEGSSTSLLCPGPMGDLWPNSI